MSTNPVQAPNLLNSLEGPRSLGPDARSRQSSELPRQLAKPNSGAEPKPVRHDLEHAPQSFELPQDVVQVQRDRETNNQIVIRYLDASGELILQVPSSQVLGLSRAIAQTFEEQACARKSRDASNSELEGEKSRGH